MPNTKSEILAALQTSHQQITALLTETQPDAFFAHEDSKWSAAGYLKHLIISNKAFAKALGFPLDTLATMFGQADPPSQPYQQIVARYQQRITDGMRAEDGQGLTPEDFRLPDDLARDSAAEQSYLHEQWNVAHSRITDALENWSEADLDTHQIPHPAIGVISMREMFFFTVHHNQLHANDMQNAINGA